MHGMYVEIFVLSVSFTTLSVLLKSCGLEFTFVVKGRRWDISCLTKQTHNSKKGTNVKFQTYIALLIKFHANAQQCVFTHIFIHKGRGWKKVIKKEAAPPKWNREWSCFPSGELLWTLGSPRTIHISPLSALQHLIVRLSLIGTHLNSQICSSCHVRTREWKISRHISISEAKIFLTFV
jgi:hypothetical protein